MYQMEYMPDENGSTAVEFALVAPIFFLLIFGIIEFSLVMFAQSVMEGTTSMTSRLGKTGYSAEGLSRQQTLVNMLVAQSQGILEADKIEITTLIYENFDSIGKPEPFTDSNHNGGWDTGESYTDVNGNGAWDEDMGETGLGGAGDIVVYKIHYPWTVRTPFISQFLGNSVPLNTSVVVRNEPYENIR